MKTIAQTFSKEAKTRRVARRDAPSSFDLNTNDATVRVFKNEVDLMTVTIAKMGKGRLVGAPRELLAEFHRNEAFK